MWSKSLYKVCICSHHPATKCVKPVLSPVNIEPRDYPDSIVTFLVTKNRNPDTISKNKSRLESRDSLSIIFTEAGIAVPHISWLVVSRFRGTLYRWRSFLQYRAQFPVVQIGMGLPHLLRSRTLIALMSGTPLQAT